MVISMVETITTTVTRRLYDKAKENKIGWSEALRVGIGVILAEKGDVEYCGELNIFRKIERMALRYDEKVQEVEKLAGELATLKEMGLRK